MRGVDKEHSCITHRHREQCGDGRDRGVGTGWRCAKGGEIGTSVIVSAIKIKLEKIIGKSEEVYGSSLYYIFAIFL